MIDNALMRTDDDHRPYAAAANVVGVIDRIRRINLPEAIDAAWLDVARVPDASRGRVLDALRFLRLIHPGGEPTEELEAIASATDDEYRELLAARVRQAYAADLSRIDPAQDPQATIISQFRRYQPRSQTMRMVMLFLGLCRSAGMPVLEAPRQRAMRGAATPAVRQPRSNTSNQQNQTPRSGRHAPAPTPDLPGQTVAIRLEDLALIEDEKAYQAAWTALGTVTRAAARARQAREASERKAQDSEG